MILIPFERVSIKTNSSRDETIQRLSISLEEKYKTKIKDYEFNIPKWVGRGIRIIINGQIKDQFIDIVVRPSYPTITIMFFFLVTFIIINSTRKDIVEFVFPLLLLAGIYAWLIFTTKSLSKKFKKFLAEIFGQ
ncbi:MAG: hypothetical protein NTY34_06890 [Candidatus Omnitrophica bacterium]|nr:hypothetical protein [Candidatus Omnitrophota bacterium]